MVQKELIMDFSITEIDLSLFAPDEYNGLPDRFPSVRVLHAQRCGLHDISFCRRWTALESVDFSDNTIISVPEWFCGLEFLEEVYLNGCRGLKDISPLFKISSLKVLYLCDCNLAQIPDCQTSSFEYLHLRKNHLQDLPASFSGLPKLKLLDLAENRLERIPAALNGLKSLESLDLSNNLLHIGVASQYYWPVLEQLALGSNSLTKIPSWIFALSELKELDLNSNAIAEIPAEIEKLTHLVDLDISNNRLSKFPPQLAKILTGGLNLNVFDNPFPDDVLFYFQVWQNAGLDDLELQNAALRNYLQDKSVSIAEIVEKIKINALVADSDLVHFSVMKHSAYLIDICGKYPSGAAESVKTRLLEMYGDKKVHRILI